MPSLTPPLRLLSFLALGIVFSSTPARTQQPPAPPNRITLNVVVTDRSGPPIPNLQSQDFTLLDNKTPRPITSFRALAHPDPSAPVEVFLIVDAVNTSYHTIAFERTEIDKFLHLEGGHLAHPTTLAVVTDTGTQAQQGFSLEGSEVSAALDHYTVSLRSITRSSGFYGAEERFSVSLTALETLAQHAATLPGRKIFLWISPGWPLLSGPRIELSNHQQQQLFSSITSLSTALRNANITLYAVDPLGSGEGLMRTSYYKEFLKGVDKPSKVDAADLALQVLALQSGGLALDSSNDITGLLARCAADTNAYYELTFDPPPADHPNEYHSLEIKLSQPNLTARTRQGYYLQPQTPDK